MVTIQKYTPKDHFINALIYGASGSGKTSFGGTAKDVIIASAEGGLLSIADKNVDFVEIKTLKDLQELLNHLRTGKHEFRTVVIDSITEINDIIISEIEERTGKSMQLQNWGELQKKIKNTLRGYRDLKMHVIFLALEKQITNDTKIEKIVPEINGKSATSIAAYMDIVGYLYLDKMSKRILSTVPSPMFLTKDRSNLIGHNAPLDFSKWVELITEGNKPAKEQVEKIKTLIAELFSDKKECKKNTDSTLAIASDKTKAEGLILSLQGKVEKKWEEAEKEAKKEPVEVEKTATVDDVVEAFPTVEETK